MACGQFPVKQCRIPPNPFAAQCSCDQPKAIFPGIVARFRRAAVNHDGQLRRRRQFHLPYEDFFLHVPRRVIVKIIQPDLAPGDHLRMLRQAFHVLIGGFIRQPGFMGMNADRRVDEIVLFRQANSAVDVLGTVAVADGDDGLHSSLARPRDHLLAVGVELLPSRWAWESTNMVLDISSCADVGTSPVQPSVARLTDAPEV